MTGILEREKIVERIKILILLLAGLTTLIMQKFVPIGGGGISLIFVLSVPILIGISFLFSITHYLMWIKRVRPLIRHILFVFFLGLLIGLAIYSYPYR